MRSLRVRGLLFATGAAVAIAAAAPLPSAAATTDLSATSNKWTVTAQSPITLRVAVPKNAAKSLIELNVIAIEPIGAMPKIRLFAGSGTPANGPNSGKYLTSFETKQGGTGTYRFVADLSGALADARPGSTIDVTVVVVPATASARDGKVSVTIGNLDIQDVTRNAEMQPVTQD